MHLYTVLTSNKFMSADEAQTVYSGSIQVFALLSP